MGNNGKKIILWPNAERDIGLAMTRKVKGILANCGRSTLIYPVLGNDLTPIPEGIEPAALDTELPQAELIITFGGDGTILHTARATADFGVPLLGINMGGKGFLAELEVQDVNMIEAVASGGYMLDRRMMLDIELMRNGKTIHADFALNDVVVSGVNKVIDLTLLGDGQRISRFSGNGTVISTPTGSTAYSMSAGGPIVEPMAHNIIITPICAHVLEAKSFVLVPERRVSVEVGYKKSNPAYMSVDGCDFIPIQSGDVINIRKSDKYTYFARVSSKSFYNMVSEKLGERI